MAEGLEQRWQDALAHEDISIKRLDRPALVLVDPACETSFRPVPGSPVLSECEQPSLVSYSHRLYLLSCDLQAEPSCRFAVF